MRRFVTALAIVVLLVLVAPPVRAVQVAAEADGPSREEELEEIRRLEETVDAAREALAILEERLRRAKAGESGDVAVADVEQLESAVSELRSRMIEGEEALQVALVEFINADPPIEGERMTPAVEEALRIKAGEDVILGQEYINQGGDYDRAIQIFEDVLTYAPDNPEAIAARERARKLRYVDAERFARVSVGMTKSEVREALGPVNLRNIRTYEDLGLRAWFYPKGPKERPAAVYFWVRGDQWEVYRTEYDVSEPNP